MSGREVVWPEVRIGDLGMVVTGRTPPTDQPIYFGNAFPFVTPGDMRQGKYSSRTERRLSASGADLLNRIKIPAKSVCVSCIGWQMGESIITATESFTNQQINTIVPHEGVDASFLYYSLKPRKRELLSVGSGTGVRTPILNKSAFCNLKVKIPPLPEQRRIASILSAYDDLIAVNRRRVEVLEEMARRLFDEWFVRLRFPGHATTPTHDTPDGPLPEGWARKPFSTVASFTNGYAFKPDDWGKTGRPIIKIRELKEGVTPATPRYEGELDERYRIMPGVLLFSWSAHLEAYVWAGDEGWLNQHLFVVQGQAGMNRAYLFHALRHAMPHFQLRANGSTMKHIKRAALDEVSILQPTQPVLDQFARLVEPMIEARVTYVQAMQRLAAARDLLLPRLLSGQLPPPAALPLAAE